MSWQVLASFVLQAARRARAPQTGWQAALRHLGGVGLFFLAIIDSSPIPTFGGLDIVTAVLAASHRQPWFYYAIMATAGAVVGSFLTYEAARKAGEPYLTKRFGHARVQKLLGMVRQWGGGTLVVSTILPPPFPTSAVFAAAGILKYPTKRYLSAIAIGRAIRYSLISLAADKYGRHFIRLLRHPQRYLGWSVLIAGLLLLMIAGGVVIWLWGRHQGAEIEGAGEPQTQSR